MTDVVDVAALLAGDGPRIRWSTTAQLQANLVRLGPHERIDEHVEGHLDVLLVVVHGVGTLTADGVASPVSAPSVVVLPAGTRRAVTAGPDGLAYVTAHQRRTGMTP